MGYTINLRGKERQRKVRVLAPIQELVLHMLQDIYNKFIARERERREKNRANLIINLLYKLTLT